MEEKRVVVRAHQAECAVLISEQELIAAQWAIRGEVCCATRTQARALGQLLIDLTEEPDGSDAR